jgi:hypothetical protein
MSDLLRALCTHDWNSISSLLAKGCRLDQFEDLDGIQCNPLHGMLFYSNQLDAVQATLQRLAEHAEGSFMNHEVFKAALLQPDSVGFSVFHYCSRNLALGSLLGDLIRLLVRMGYPEEVELLLRSRVPHGHYVQDLDVPRLAAVFGNLPALHALINSRLISLDVFSTRGFIQGALLGLNHCTVGLEVRILHECQHTEWLERRGIRELGQRRGRDRRRFGPQIGS